MTTDDEIRAEDYRNWIAEDQPIPLTVQVPVPTFPVDSFPPAIANMINALAEATQTDPAMPATSALNTLATCAGGHVVIEVRPGWREALGLYTATVAEPGERKSAVQAAMCRPLYDVERELADKAKPERLEAETRLGAATLAAEAARRAAAVASDAPDADAKMADAIGAAMLADAIEVPPVPRLVADDVTPEALASLLAEQKGRLAVISSEGGIFDIIAGRYNGHVPNLDIWLKAHSGDPIRIDRKGKPPEYIDNPTLTLGLMIQPEVLRVIATQRQFRGRGLLARFLYALPGSRVGRRNVASAPVPVDTLTAYRVSVTRLARGLAEWLKDPAVLTLTPAAQTAVMRVEAATEPQLRDDGDLAALKDWGAKYVGAVVRIAGILHLAHLGPELGPRTPVDVEMVLKAARIGSYFRACAINAFWDMGTDPRTAGAVYLLDRVHSLGQQKVSERDMQRVAQRFQRKDELLDAVAVLVEHGYLECLPKPKRTGGRPPSPRYRLTLTERTKGR